MTGDRTTVVGTVRVGSTWSYTASGDGQDGAPGGALVRIMHLTADQPAGSVVRVRAITPRGTAPGPAETAEEIGTAGARLVITGEPAKDGLFIAHTIEKES